MTLPREADLNAQDSGVVSSRTTWTLLLYLTSATEGCQGGETVFYLNDRQVEKEAITVSLETGMLLLHKHGDDCMLVSNHLPRIWRMNTIVIFSILDLISADENLRSMRDVKLRREKSGCCDQTYASEDNTSKPYECFLPYLGESGS